MIPVRAVYTGFSLRLPGGLGSKGSRELGLTVRGWWLVLWGARLTGGEDSGRGGGDQDREFGIRGKQTRETLVHQEQRHCVPC